MGGCAGVAGDGAAAGSSKVPPQPSGASRFSSSTAALDSATGAALSAAGTALTAAAGSGGAAGLGTCDGSCSQPSRSG